MKKTFLSLLLLVAATTMSAQSLLLGDTDQNGTLTIADVTKTVNMVLYPETQQTFDLSPYRVDNSLVAGTWYAPDGTSFTLESDGTTTYPGGATYKFMPYQGLLMVYKANGAPLRAMSLCEVSSESLLVVNYASGTFTRYLSTGPFVLATSISLSETSLALELESYKKLRATILPANATNTSVVWSSSNENVATVSNSGMVEATGIGSCTITCAATDGSGIEAECIVTVVSQPVTAITLSSSTLNLCKNLMYQLTAIVEPSNADNTNLTWESSNESVAMVNQTGMVTGIAEGTCTIMVSATDGSGVSATCTVNVDIHECVDLGLPSGTLWAMCNIGADYPEDYGDYFAWGETTGYYDGKSFTAGTYKYVIITQNGSGAHYTWTKYNSANTELEPEDDAAYVKWGSGWRMPSKEQFNELINSSYTTILLTTWHGVYGRLITSKSNGNSIFLPAAGYRRPLLYDAGSNDYYWSRSVVGSSQGDAYTHTSSMSRYSGLSVRPVRVSQ